jgi:hypothetical protein
MPRNTTKNTETPDVQGESFQPSSILSAILGNNKHEDEGETQVAPGNQVSVRNPDEPIFAPEPQPQAAVASPEEQVPAVADDQGVDPNQPRPMGLQFFALTNSWRINNHGERTEANELMGGFVYQMSRDGRLADTEENYRRLFDTFCNS